MSKRWDRVEELYHAELELSPDLRAGFLREACGEEESIHREVESLLAQDTRSSGFLDDWAVQAAANLLDSRFSESPSLITQGDAPQVFPRTDRFAMLRQFRAGGMGL